MRTPSLLLFATIILLELSEMTCEQAKFKAAVYEHALILPDTSRILNRGEALEAMMQNLGIYAQQAKIAKHQGANIIVFPEDGLYGFYFNRTTIFPFLENIPDPSVTSSSLCDGDQNVKGREVQTFLSCIAKNNSIYVVANIGDKQPCNPRFDPKCPPDGRYQYNTAVAFGPDGLLLARYHKVNLFFEEQYDEPEAEIVTFDTPFGRFGLFICFDILFYKPAVAMVKEKNITNVIFPTAWMDALPLLSSIGFHSSFARGLGVNLLAANIHLPQRRFHGSGIYSPRGMEAFYYNNSVESSPKLLVAEIDVLKEPMPVTGVCDQNPNVADDLKSTPSPINGKTFNSLLFADNFTFTALNKPSDSLDVCQNGLCCHLDYAIQNNGNKTSEDLFGVGVFDGLHTNEGQYYLQICALVKCANETDHSTCGSPTTESQTFFSVLEMSGTFSTEFVFPQLVLHDSTGGLSLAEAERWSYRDQHLSVSSNLKQPLLYASLFGRVYSRDDGHFRDTLDSR